jgi:hypothetical protein
MAIWPNSHIEHRTLKMTYERDAWDETGDQGNGIEGSHLKCAKGRWLLDDAEIETGENGFKLCLILDTTIVGEILWQDQKIVEREIGRIADGFIPPKRVQPGWSPYVAFQGVRADDEHLGELVTFTSSSWGGRYAFQSLVNPFRLKQRMQFPIAILGTKERGDANGNIDPVFKIVGWSNRENFQELLPPPVEAQAAIAFAPAAKKAAAEIVNDEIPF